MFLELETFLEFIPFSHGMEKVKVGIDGFKIMEYLEQMKINCSNCQGSRTEYLDFG